MYPGTLYIPIYLNFISYSQCHLTDPRGMGFVRGIFRIRLGEGFVRGIFRILLGIGNISYILKNRYPTHFPICHSFPDNYIWEEFTYDRYKGACAGY